MGLKEALNLVEEVAQFWTNHPRELQLQYTKIRKVGELEYIHMQVWIPEYKAWCGDSFIVINTITGRIERGSCSSWIYGDKRISESAHAAFALTLPALLPLAPMFLLNEKIRAHREKRLCISRHCTQLLHALKETLPPKIRYRLKQAMLATWQHEQKMCAQIDIHEAQQVLRQCKLVEEFTHDKRADDTAVARGLFFHWTNDKGETVARGTFHDDHGIIRILGSVFTGNEAEILSRYYHTREAKQH